MAKKKTAKTAADKALPDSAGSVNDMEFVFRRMHKHQAWFTAFGGWEIDAMIGYYSRIQFNMTGREIKEASESWTVRAPDGREFYSQNNEVRRGA